MSSIYDPAILLPSVADRHNAKFWTRLFKITRAKGAETIGVGSSTYVALNDFLAHDVGEYPNKNEIFAFLQPLISCMTPHQGNILSGESFDEILSMRNSSRSDFDQLLHDDLRIPDDTRVAGLCCDGAEWPAGAPDSQSAELTEGIIVLHDGRKDFSVRGLDRTTVKNSPRFDFDSLCMNAAGCFPGLTFCDSAFSRISSLEGDKAWLTHETFRHLEVLNDVAKIIFGSETQPEEIQKRFKEYNVDCSPESPAVAKDKKRKRARYFSSGDKEIYCGWHTKLEPNRNRIYFTVTSQAVYVGSIERHLP